MDQAQGSVPTDRHTEKVTNGDPSTNSGNAFASRKVVRSLLIFVVVGVALYAAATLAYFEDSEKYLARDKEKPIIAKMVEAIPEGVRSAEGVQTDLQQLEQTYRQAGPGLKSLFDR